MNEEMQNKDIALTSKHNELQIITKEKDTAQASLELEKQKRQECEESLKKL